MAESNKRQDLLELACLRCMVFTNEPVEISNTDLCDLEEMFDSITRQVERVITSYVTFDTLGQELPWQAVEDLQYIFLGNEIIQKSTNRDLESWSIRVARDIAEIVDHASLAVFPKNHILSFDDSLDIILHLVMQYCTGPRVFM